VLPCLHSARPSSVRTAADQRRVSVPAPSEFVYDVAYSTTEADHHDDAPRHRFTAEIGAMLRGSLFVPTLHRRIRDHTAHGFAGSDPRCPWKARRQSGPRGGEVDDAAHPTAEVQLWEGDPRRGEEV
jgi:hypothetical protein